MTTSVDVNSKPYIEEVNNVDDKNLEIIANGGSGPYEFKFGQNWSYDNNIYEYIENKFYNIQIRDGEGCVTDTTIQAPIHGLTIPILVTPNGDGVNDIFEIKNLDKYPEATITIYNGRGVKLIEYNSRECKGWDGNYNGHRMCSDDYWYEINIKELDKVIVGHFTLMRD
jgi:gliding motility-associated-like protein